MALALLLALSLAFAAADKSDFSGTWVLDHAQSDFGVTSVPPLQTNVIEHKEPNIRMATTSKGDRGTHTTERSYITDGKEHTLDVGPGRAKSTSKWDGAKLVTQTKIEGPDGILEIDDLWELADGGKQMIIRRDFKGPQGEASQKLVYRKK
jgi:hypothetical protein